MKTMFTPLPAETCPAVETATSITDTFPFTSQDAKQTLKSRKKRRPKDTSDEDMLIYDVAEEVESPQKLTPVNEIEKFSDEWWQAEGWKREEYSRTLTPTPNSSSTAKTFFGFINKICVLFSKSSKRWDIVKTKLKLTLKPLSETRWESRIGAVKAIFLQFDDVIECVNELKNKSDDSETLSDCDA
ncbi:zinc finger MYM-type protein 1 [Trichonephila clavipes]|nr:zinc finger MYM-type protein 1 [Trichonephila clavipes]